MKKLIIFLTVALISLTSFAQLPNVFKLDEYVMSIGTDFKIIGVASGYIDEDIISLTSNFTLKLSNILCYFIKVQN